MYAQFLNGACLRTIVVCVWVGGLRWRKRTRTRRSGRPEPWPSAGTSRCAKIQ